MFRKLICFFCLVIFLVNVKTTFAEDGAVKAKVITKIVNGRTVSPKKIAVAKIFKKNRPFSCSGVLITRSHILTASHCLSGRPGRYSIMVAKKRYHVKRVKHYPRAKKDRREKIYNNDIAILKLTEKIYDIDPIPILRSKPLVAGDIIDIYGYGEDKWGHSGYLIRGTTIVDNIDDYFIDIKYDNKNESIPCFGDSGGPAIYSYVSGDGVIKRGIVGITSWSSTTDCSLNSKTFYVDTQRQEIVDFIKKVARKVKFK